MCRYSRKTSRTNRLLPACLQALRIICFKSLPTSVYCDRSRAAQLISLKSPDFLPGDTTFSRLHYGRNTRLSDRIDARLCFPHVPEGAKTRQPGGGAVADRAQVREMPRDIVGKSIACKSWKWRRLLVVSTIYRLYLWCFVLYCLSVFFVYKKQKMNNSIVDR